MKENEQYKYGTLYREKLMMCNPNKMWKTNIWKDDENQLTNLSKQTGFVRICLWFSAQGTMNCMPLLTKPQKIRISKCFFGLVSYLICHGKEAIRPELKKYCLLFGIFIFLSRKTSFSVNFEHFFHFIFRAGLHFTVAFCCSF